MNIILYKMTSEEKRIGKNKTSPVTFSGALRHETSILRPEILVEADETITGYNYMYIPDFGRYYFIDGDGVRSIRTNMWVVPGRVDVLESFKNQILQQPVILDLSETAGVNPYTKSPAWQTSVKEKTDIITFSNGLLDNGEFILITAGG